jgi:hypothetical protein
MRCLKYIHQSNYIPMLAPFQYIKLPLLLRHLYHLHTRLLYSLDRDESPRLDVVARAHLPELPLPQRVSLVEGVEIEERPVARLVT